MAKVTKYAFLTILILQLIIFTVHLATIGFRSQFWSSTSFQDVNSEIPRSIFVSISRRSNPSTEKFQVGTKEDNNTSNMTTMKHVIRENKHKYHATRSHTYTGNNNEVRNTNKKMAVSIELNEGVLKSMSQKIDSDSGKYFQSIDDKAAWLYSAFFDHVAERNKLSMVRVFGVVNVEYMGTVFCYASHGRIQQITTGLLIPMPDGHDREFRPSYINCNLTNGFRPTHVSISFLSEVTPTNRLTVIYPEPAVRNVTVCYSILHSQYKTESQLIFSIETNRLLGADHFVVYNHSMSARVDRILRQYQKDGLVSILQWPIPTFKSWYYSQMTAINDCFYRNRNSSQYVVVLDTDELIIPTHHSTWMEIIDNVTREEILNPSCRRNCSEFVKIDKNAHAPIGSYMILSCFFSTNSQKWDKDEWESLPSKVSFSNEEKNAIIKYQMYWFLEFWRTIQTFPAKVRSKYIARPELVDIAGIHYVHNFTNGAKYVTISENIALVHHYRQTGLLNNVTTVIKTTDKHKYGVLQDTSLLKFKRKLYPRVIRQYQLFDDIFTL